MCTCRESHHICENITLVSYWVLWMVALMVALKVVVMVERMVGTLVVVLVEGKVDQ